MEWSLNSPKLPSALSYVATHKTAFDVISFGVINFYVTWELFIIYYPSITLWMTNPGLDIVDYKII